jgi:hypothetical protein
LNGQGFNSQTKFLFITFNSNRPDPEKIFKRFKILNYAVISIRYFGSDDESFKIFTYNPFSKTTSMIRDSNHPTLSEIFPDKLRNLHGHPYQLLHFKQAPYFEYKDGGVLTGLETYFLG